MSKDSNLQLPLLKLFDRLQKEGLPLGIDEYKLALYALQSRYGIQDYEALARLCRSLWVKSEEEKLRFNYHFEQVMAEEAESSTLLDDAPILPKLEVEKKKSNFSLAGLSPRKVVWGSTLLLVAGVCISLFRPQPKTCPYFLNVPIKPVKVNESYSEEVKVCKANQTDKLNITLVNRPPWLEPLKPNEGAEGKITLRGKPKKETYESVHLWDLDSGKQVGEFKHQGSDDDSVASLPLFSPNGSHFATLESGNIVRLWNLSNRQVGKDLKHFGRVYDMSFSPEGQMIATASGDGFLRLWDLSGNLRKKIKHQKRVFQVTFSPDGQYIISISDDGSTRLWDISGKKLADLSTSRWGFYDNKYKAKAIFSADGQHLITLFTREGRLFDVSLWHLYNRKLTETKLHPEIGPTDYRDIQLSPDAQYFAVIQYNDDTVILYNFAGENIAEINSPSAGFNKIEFSPDGQRIVIGSNDRIARMWEPFKDRYGKHARKLKHQASVTDVSFNRDGRLVATASEDGEVRLWDMSSSKELKKFTHQGNVKKISFSSDGKHLITTSGEDQHQVKLQVSDASGTIKDTQAFNIKVLPSNPLPNNTETQQLTVLIIAGVVAFLVWSGGYAIARYWLEYIAKSSLDSANDLLEPLSTPTASTTEKTGSPEDVVQVVKAVRQATGVDIGEYFPVTRRQMKQSWRYLRRFVREGPATELDVEATVNQFARQGVLLQPALIPRRVNRAELLLLFDRDGSMMPFHALSRRLAETATQGGRLAKADVYYFHNCPAQIYEDPSNTKAKPKLYIYKDPNCCEAKPLIDILASYSDSAGVLIFSDAGASRGSLNLDRVDISEDFLQQIKQRMRYIAWLNPMPKERWAETTAEKIAHLVPMFEFSRQGLQGAIAVLRGKFTFYRL
ncbi:eIF2A-related protein [Tolypothrix sp. VBCCA 56010]|uniref:WD40 domain-containing protein n=1 Tax=Tolypothrix sp. VBCCA 56010 TaxID=3137731 RepID=UPI003D7F1227